MAAGLYLAVECLPYGDRARLLAVGYLRRRTHGDAGLGLGPVALLGEFARHLRDVWRDRVLLLLETQAGHALQVQRQVSRRCSLRCVLVQEPEPRQLPAHLSFRHTD